MAQSRERLAEEYSVLAQVAEELQREIQLAQTLIAEVDSAILALKNISSLEDGKEILVPVSAGVYVRASIKRQEKFLVAIGSNILVEKSLDEAVEFLNKRKEELSQLVERRMNDLNKVVARIREIESSIR
ncbi:prefoldin subunit alpha [Thermofilum pendens]|uniref:Prefoldin subunit alpha n=1 Tax=Thermofilum pendens (strain DSM 2475 / Hrk 5) TaxID=368408 RepID=PFDA_THEPD|nr:RecName: Full=Prefoldin subunit alpha; AltName: Full=GimC subunit alpha [Thermofilum pendens Hrk 5]ABL77839.1 prefoldin, alpha subunit [Thermofilum pendens Hrk 5]